MKLSGLGKLFTLLYDDRIDIYRTTRCTNDDDTVDISYQPEPLYTDIPCRLSFNNDDTGSDSEVDRDPIKASPKIFSSIDVDWKAGDYVVVRRYTDEGRVSMTYRGRIALPTWYSTHQETFMRIDEGA